MVLNRLDEYKKPQSSKRGLDEFGENVPASKKRTADSKHKLKPAKKLMMHGVNLLIDELEKMPLSVGCL